MLRYPAPGEMQSVRLASFSEASHGGLDEVHCQTGFITGFLFEQCEDTRSGTSFSSTRRSCLKQSRRFITPTTTVCVAPSRVCETHSIRRSSTFSGVYRERRTTVACSPSATSASTNASHKLSEMVSGNLT